MYTRRYPLTKSTKSTARPITRPITKLAFKADLQPHQERVLTKLRTKDALLLYHGLGSGKTLSSIAATEGLRSNIIVPASLRENYKKELHKFKANQASRNILSYEGAISKGLPQADALIVDEAHRLGTSGSKRTQVVYDAIASHKKRLLLTGTPIRNRPHELAPLIKVLNPKSNIPLAQSEFNQRFLRNEEVHGKGWDRVKEFLGVMEPGVRQVIKNVPQLRSALEGRVDYHAPDTTYMPSVTSKIISVEMDDDQKNIYNTVVNQANPIIAAKVRSNMPLSKKELTQMNAFMTAARMASNTTKPYGGTGTSNKVKTLVRDTEKMMQSNPRHKGLVYSNYLDGGLNEVSKELSKKNIKHKIFSGALKDKERKELVQEFNSGKTPIMLLSAAGTEGLDLKGGRSVQILEPHWNNTRLNQAIGRVVRHKSHEHLPEKERNVSVMHYRSTLPKTWIQEKLNRDADTAADQYLSELSATKDDLNNQFLDILRTA